MYLLLVNHNHTKLVDRRGIEPRLKACKAPVLPLSLPAHETYLYATYHAEFFSAQTFASGILLIQ